MLRNGKTYSSIVRTGGKANISTCSTLSAPPQQRESLSQIASDREVPAAVAEVAGARLASPVGALLTIDPASIADEVGAMLTEPAPKADEAGAKLAEQFPARATLAGVPVKITEAVRVGLTGFPVTVAEVAGVSLANPVQVSLTEVPAVVAEGSLAIPGGVSLPEVPVKISEVVGVLLTNGRAKSAKVDGALLANDFSEETSDPELFSMRPRGYRCGVAVGSDGSKHLIARAKSSFIQASVPSCSSPRYFNEAFCLHSDDDLSEQEMSESKADEVEKIHVSKPVPQFDWSALDMTGISLGAVRVSVEPTMSTKCHPHGERSWEDVPLADERHVAGKSRSLSVSGGSVNPERKNTAKQKHDSKRSKRNRERSPSRAFSQIPQGGYLWSAFGNPENAQSSRRFAKSNRPSNVNIKKETPSVEESESSSPSLTSSSSDLDLDTSSSSSSGSLRKRQKRKAYKKKLKVKRMIALSKSVKFPEPTEYNGNADLEAFETFVFELKNWLEWSRMPTRYRMVAMKRFLTEKAGRHYMAFAAVNLREYTVDTYLVSLFNHCFPPHFRSQMRAKFEGCVQGNRTVREFIRELKTLGNRLSDVQEIHLRLRFWDGAATYLRLEWARAGLDAETSSLTRLEQAAERFEIAELLRQKEEAQAGKGQEQSDSENPYPSRRRREHRHGRHRQRNRTGTWDWEQGNEPADPPHPGTSDQEQSPDGYHHPYNDELNSPGKEVRSDEHRNKNSRREQRLTWKEKVQLQADGKCFSCKSTGHFSRDCPSKEFLSNPTVGAMSFAEIEKLNEEQNSLPLYAMSFQFHMKGVNKSDIPEAPTTDDSPISCLPANNTMEVNDEVPPELQAATGLEHGKIGDSDHPCIDLEGDSKETDNQGMLHGHCKVGVVRKAPSSQTEGELQDIPEDKQKTRITPLLQRAENMNATQIIRRRGKIQPGRRQPHIEDDDAYDDHNSPLNEVPCVPAHARKILPTRVPQLTHLSDRSYSSINTAVGHGQSKQHRRRWPTIADAEDEYDCGVDQGTNSAMGIRYSRTRNDTPYSIHGFIQKYRRRTIPLSDKDLDHHRRSTSGWNLMLDRNPRRNHGHRSGTTRTWRERRGVHLQGHFGDQKPDRAYLQLRHARTVPDIVKTSIERLVRFAHQEGVCDVSALKTLLVSHHHDLFGRLGAPERRRRSKTALRR